MPFCTKCDTDKDVSEFSMRKTGKPSSWCKACLREYNLTKYHASEVEKTRIRKNRLASRDRAVTYIDDYKKDKSCVRCGFSHPAALDFHHLNPDDKRFTLGAAKRGYSCDALKAEIEKCIILCSNCHRIEHYG